MALAIDARDFYHSQAQDQYGVWTPDRLRCAVEALGDAEVVVVIDRHSGHAIQGRLSALTTIAFSAEPRLPVTYRLSDGSEQTILFRVSHIGVIMELDKESQIASAKWRALEAWRKIEAAEADRRRKSQAA